MQQESNYCFLPRSLQICIFPQDSSTPAFTVVYLEVQHLPRYTPKILPVAKMANEKQNEPESVEPTSEKALPSSVDMTSAEEDEVYSAFSAATRRFLTYFLGFAMVLSSLTATIYFPLIPMLANQFRVSVQAINLTITAYSVAQALSPALFASLADSVGRRPVLLSLVALYAAASLGLILSRDSYAALLALRVVQSISGSPIPALAYGVAADVTPTAERGAMLGPMLSTCNAISAVGPIIGGGVALGTSGAQWVFLALLIVAVVCFVLGGFALPETLRTLVGNGGVSATGIWRTWWSVLRRGKKPRGAKGGISRVSEADRWRVADAFVSFRMFLYKDAIAVLWMIAVSYTIYSNFQVAIPVIFARIYGYNELYIGLACLSGLVGMTLGGIIAGKLVDRNYAIARREHGVSAEEDKKELALGDFPIEAARYRNCLAYIFAQVILVAGYGWTVHFRVHPSVPIILQFIICGFSTLLSHTASALLIDIFPDKSSTAYASGQVARCGVSAAFTAILQPLVDAVGYGWYFTIFSVFVGVSLAACVIVSRVRGKTWRQSRYKNQDVCNTGGESEEPTMFRATRHVTPKV